jgi:hypothetical protein
MESDWVKIYSAVNFTEAEILRNKLEDGSIPCTLINKQDSMHLHLNTQQLIDIYVSKENAFEAVQIIKRSIANDQE